MIGEQKAVWSGWAARIRNRRWIGIASKTAAFRLRAAHSGDEDRPPAEWQRSLPTLVVALIAVPANP
jgi:hypothetical protein